AWSCVTITPVSVNAYDYYNVGVDSLGTGGTRRNLGNNVANQMPRTLGDITVEEGCVGTAGGATDPCLGTTSFQYYSGQLDIKFAPENATALQITTAPQTITAGSCSGPTQVDTRGCNGSIARSN